MKKEKNQADVKSKHQPVKQIVVISKDCSIYGVLNAAAINRSLHPQ